MRTTLTLFLLTLIINAFPFAYAAQADDYYITGGFGWDVKEAHSFPKPTSIKDAAYLFDQLKHAPVQASEELGEDISNGIILQVGNMPFEIRCAALKQSELRGITNEKVCSVTVITKLLDFSKLQLDAEGFYTGDISFTGRLADQTHAIIQKAPGMKLIKNDGFNTTNLGNISCDSPYVGSATCTVKSVKFVAIKLDKIASNLKERNDLLSVLYLR